MDTNRSVVAKTISLWGATSVGFLMALFLRHNEIGFTEVGFLFLLLVALLNYIYLLKALRRLYPRLARIVSIIPIVYFFGLKLLNSCLDTQSIKLQALLILIFLSVINMLFFFNLKRSEKIRQGTPKRFEH